MAAKKNILRIIGPGILVAATGVGAGDLATAAFTGSRLGVTVLWAVVIGAVLKLVLNEGLTRWQLATGRTLLEGCVEQFGKTFQGAFLLYLVVWSFLVALALMSACGATMHALLPLGKPENDKIIYGIVHSAVAVVLVHLGGFRLFEKVMAACIAVMFLVVVVTAVALRPPIGEILSGMFLPLIPELRTGGLAWTVALMGGIGGTLTILSYGYWIREEGRQKTGDLRDCRIDLTTGYAMTAIFGMAMLIIGSRLPPLEGGGAALLVTIADSLQQPFGRFGLIAKYAFLIGAWGAVFSSLLGVWQSIPYLFTDFWMMSQVADRQAPRSTVDTKSRPYRAYLVGMATIPALGFWVLSFREAQKIYAIVGALVIPALAVILLYLNNRVDLVGRENRNGWWSNLVLALAPAFFLYVGWLEIRERFW
jgi:Mn2+/Fe2+ NRAMP family transporter